MTPMVFPVVAHRVDYVSAFRADHPGVDIFADLGSPVVAISDGVASTNIETKGGNALYLSEPDETQYFYGHLDSFEGEFPRHVSAGEVIGYVGTTGSARGTPPHVHLEVRPKGGERVDPVAMLNSISIRSQSLENIDIPERAPISAVWKAPKRGKSTSIIPIIIVGALIYWGSEREARHGA